MSGETDLETLLHTMTAKLDDSTYVFATLARHGVPPDIKPRMVFEEEEGTTFILKLSDAERHNLPYEFACRMITLDVHSSLEAVGFIARISAALTKAGMGVNPVSGFYHDHLFVPLGREDEAMRVLAQLAKSQS
ncbi:ACT domain-containing protein [Roseobacter denitrificans]|uniref:DUF2241 domain-containing protein n=1 Tax=Roseobacter denitrificans (strain ATCC 33942 / OCh 114) TaxID=375451 RepID=Q167T8_ROSDO|nr:ACT domain-containing protein [Roseobacter denitrificans]ABG31755.1 hypothetical protein RD1_2160 [Roseobacter denitrificans OCh 114]AVL51332.1 ACT domain-containing protein [Roseobacter denitrificans]SFF87367.1 hypothetical protein SAMN05443635_10380 [Roseobacter denitrificans OCh 114]